MQTTTVYEPTGEPIRFEKAAMTGLRADLVKEKLVITLEVKLTDEVLWARDSLRNLTQDGQIVEVRVQGLQMRLLDSTPLFTFSAAGAESRETGDAE